MNYQLPNSYDKELINYQDDMGDTSGAVPPNAVGVHHNYDMTEPNYTIDIGLRYGDMPSEMLMAKFDETNIDSDTYQPLEQINDHWRTTLTDMGPEPRTMEEDQPRTDNQSKAFLNFRHHGNRSEGDYDVHMPEMFLGFHGEEDREPRGGNAGTNPMDPDFKELVKQQQARMRFIKFSPDSANWVTGGMRSEAKVQADNQEMIRQSRHRWKIFDTEYDGRRTGLAMDGGINAESRVMQQTALEQSYNDMLTQAAMDRRNKTTILSNKLFRDTTEYHQNTTDHKFKVAAYGLNPQRFRPFSPYESAIQYVATETELSGPQFTPECGKTANILMGKIVTQRHNAISDIKNGESVNNVITKTKAQERDMKSVLMGLTTDADMKGSMLMSPNDRGRTAAPVEFMNPVMTVDTDATQKQSIATMMFRSLSGSADPTKVMAMTQFGQKNSESVTVSPTSSKPLDMPVSSVGASIMTVDGKSLTTGTFKSAVRKNAVSQSQHATVDSKPFESLETGKQGRTALQQALNVRQTSHVFDNEFGRITGASQNGSSFHGTRGANSSIIKSSTEVGLGEFA